MMDSVTEVFDARLNKREGFQMPDLWDIWHRAHAQSESNEGVF